jgi:hypothetical protein
VRLSAVLSSAKLACVQSRGGHSDRMAFAEGTQRFLVELQKSFEAAVHVQPQLTVRRIIPRSIEVISASLAKKTEHLKRLLEVCIADCSIVFPFALLEQTQNVNTNPRSNRDEAQRLTFVAHQCNEPGLHPLHLIFQQRGPLISLLQSPCRYSLARFRRIPNLRVIARATAMSCPRMWIKSRNTFDVKLSHATHQLSSLGDFLIACLNLNDLSASEAKDAIGHPEMAELQVMTAVVVRISRLIFSKTCSTSLRS